MAEFPNQLPPPISLRKTIGPSFILLGLALGSGELILWPYLAATYGLGLLWGAVLGVTFQYVLNTEAMRYTLAWGESVFVGFQKIWRWLPIWFILSTFIPWSIPGFSSASAEITHLFLPFIPEKWLAIGFLILVGLLLSAGSTLYSTVEKFQKTVAIVGLPIVFGIAFWLIGINDWGAVAAGLVAKGDGWWFFPPGVAIASFLSAFAYAGAGGNLNLAQSFYIKEKGFGMGKYMGKISALFSGKSAHITLTGQHFADTAENRALWKKWWQLVTKEHLLIFWSLGLLTIIVLSALAFTTVYGQAETQGLSFLFLQAEIIGQNTIPILRSVFLIVAGLMLFGTQVGVLESSSRIISENILLLKRGSEAKHASRWFYLALWGQIGLGTITYSVGFTEPKLLITTSAILNAMAMMVSFALIYFLNKKHLLKPYRTPVWRQAILWLAALFFFYFLIKIVFPNS